MRLILACPMIDRIEIKESGGRATVLWCLLATLLLHGCGGEVEQGAALERAVYAPAGGTFVGEQTVRLRPVEPGAKMYYTLDGSLPSVQSSPYIEPLVLSATIEVRVLMVAVGAETVVLSQSYVCVSTDIANVVSNLPLMVLHTLGQGRIDDHSNEFSRAALAVFERKAAGARLLGTADLQTRIGVHTRGWSSRGSPKKSYAVEFQGGPNDDDVDLPLLGMPAESDWVLLASLKFDRSLMRDALASRMSHAIGRQASRYRFVELYLVDHGGGAKSRTLRRCVRRAGKDKTRR